MAEEASDRKRIALALHPDKGGSAEEFARRWGGDAAPEEAVDADGKPLALAYPGFDDDGAGEGVKEEEDEDVHAMYTGAEGDAALEKELEDMLAGLDFDDNIPGLPEQPTGMAADGDSGAGATADFVFRCSTPFYAHRCMLQRCQQLRPLLAATEGEAGIDVCDDMASPLRRLLPLLYTNGKAGTFRLSVPAEARGDAVGSVLMAGATLEPLHSHFAQLLACSQWADCTIMSDGDDSEQLAHAVILQQASPFFRAAFSSGLSESDSHRLRFSDCDAATTRALLRYIYTGDSSWCKEGDVVLRAISAASLLQLSSLTSQLCAMLTMEMTVASLPAVLEVADALRLLPLQQACMSFCIDHYRQLSKIGFKGCPAGTEARVRELRELVGESFIGARDLHGLREFAALLSDALRESRSRLAEAEEEQRRARVACDDNPARLERLRRVDDTLNAQRVSIALRQQYLDNILASIDGDREHA